MLITLNPVEPGPLSMRVPTGVDLEADLYFRKLDGSVVDPTPLYPQLVLLPRSDSGAFGYDIVTADAGTGRGHVSVPGINLNDQRDYSLEVYSRDAAGVPKGLLAKGVLRLEGLAYRQMGPLGPMTIPTVAGPMGPKGDPGARGSIWTTGSGAPLAPGGVDGDMYLDTATGNVWQWSAASGLWARV